MQNIKEPIITHLTDNDFYKFLMQQVFFNRFPTANSKYVFKLRNAGISLTHIRNNLNYQLDQLCNLKFQKEEIEFLDSLYINGVKIFKAGYLHMLKNFQLDRENIHVFCNGNNIEIIAEGNLYEVMFFEIFVLAIVNELYFKMMGTQPDFILAEKKFDDKMARLIDLDLTTNHSINPVTFVDFGTRRRFSKEWQYKLIRKANEKYGKIYKGTSNVYLSKEFGTMPVGTMAHEYLQAMQVLAKQGLINSQKEALEIWLDEYRGVLSVALTDVIGMESFLNDFDYLLSKAYDGTRHDSGDPFWWGDLQLSHYQKFNIDAKTKKLVFSDGLDVSMIEKLYKYFNEKTQLIFGWGTNLTNDLGIKAINIVMKIVECNNQPVVKLSDSEGKTMCEDENYVNYVKHVFNKKNKVI